VYIAIAVPLRFSYTKATQALNFFAIKNGGEINKMKALKLLYFAERYHLRKYGRLITNDTYYAMEYGPVASVAKTLSEGLRDFSQGNDMEADYASRYICPKGNRREIKSLKAVETEVFSQSDIEAFEFAWGRFSSFDQFQLSDITHLYPEWKKHEAALSSGTVSRMGMDALDFLEDAPEGADPCHPLDAAEKELRRAQVIEEREIHALWNQ